jgi:hypothetical protein
MLFGAVARIFDSPRRYSDSLRQSWLWIGVVNRGIFLLGYAQIHQCPQKEATTGSSVPRQAIPLAEKR